ncbi:MAG: hypothetical protein IJW29_09630 [Clostridia bacterium]|nr:hypothetical protein [Clostridia bacterium]
MKTGNRILSILLLLCMIVPMLPLTSLIAWAGTLSENDTESNAMTAILADGVLGLSKQGDTQSFADDGYIGIPYEVTVYYDYATHGKATAGFMTEGATPVILYVVNTRAERIGTDSDVSIIKSMLDRGYIVVVADYLNNAAAISPALEWSTQLLRAKAVAGNYFTDSTVFESGTYVDTLTVPAGYDVRLNDVYFELDKHGVDGTLEEIVTIWNNDFRGVKRDTVIKWVHEDGSRKATQNGFDGSTPVWYADAAGQTVDAENGQYTKVNYTKAEVITDCVKPDGTPIDLNLYSHLVYPTNPKEEVPLMVLYCSSGSLGECINKANRPHFAGFLFNGYAGMIAEYAYVPMERSDSYGYWAGDSTGAVTGVNMTYATYTYNATQSASAALRFARYLALSESDTYRIDVDRVGAYGISKTAWYTQLGAPILRNDLIVKADGKTDAEIAQHVNDKVNSFVQMLLPDQCSGRTRYDNGDTEAYTADGVTIDGGEIQPWAAYDGNEISSGVQANYSSCGGFMDYFCEGYAPQFFTANLSDTSYTEYGQQNIMINVSRTMNIAALWFEVDIAHDLAQGIDHNYGVDVYGAFMRFMNYYLKNTPVSVAYTNPMNGAVISTTDGITVKFVGEVSATEIEKVKITDASGVALTGKWTSAYGNTEWTFTADNMKGATAYTLTVPATLVGSNGVAMGTAYTTSFYTRAEGDVTSLGNAATLSTSGTTVNLTVPEKSASGFSIRVNVTNDAANTLYAYNAATGELMGSARISGAGYHDIDVTDYLATFAAGTEIAVQLVTETASGSVAHFEQTFDTDNGGMGFVNSDITTGQEIDGALALKVVRTPRVFAGDYVTYMNMENAYTFSTNKLIKGGSAVTKEDLGRTFLITVRVYDTVSRPVRFYMNSTTARAEKQLDFDRCYYTGMTQANEWVEFKIPYTVYEMKYGTKSQVKTFYAQFTPLGGNDANPIYLDNFKVEEVFTDISVSSVSLVSEADSVKPVQEPVSENAFLVGSTEYATWKDAMNAATSGSTVTMQSNYTLTSSDVVDLSGKNNLVIDLGGYRLTAENTSNAPLWIKATGTSAVTVTLKNGTVILGDTPLVGYGSSTTAGSGKTVNVNVENVYLTVAKASNSLNVVSEGTVTSGVKLASNIKFTDCVIDVERENLPDKTLNGVTVFHSGNSDLTVRYTFVGGTVKMNSFHEVTFCESIVKAEANSGGDYLQVLVPVGVAVPKFSIKKGSTYASLESSSTENGYAVYDVVEATYSTDYGAVPNEYADGTVYPFAIFMDEAFINGAKTWKEALTVARASLEQTPGGTVQILMRGDRSVDTYIGGANWLCYMNGTIVLDLGGKTLHAKTASLFEAGVDASYTGSFDTTLIVKNGNIFMGNNNICGVQNNTTYTKNFDISFEKVNFSVDTENFDGSKRKNLFYAQNNCKAQVNVDLTLTDCTIDLRGITTAYTVFNFYTSNDLVAANIKFIGGALIADTLSNFTWYTADATDTVRFEKGTDGSYVTLSVPNGTDPAVSLPTADGVFSFSELVTDGDERDVYTLKNDTTASSYGAIPAGYAENVFVIFTGGSCIGGKDTWKDTLTLVRETLNAKPGVEVQILMQKDREVTSYVGSANWLCYMNGSILLDLNGKTFTAMTTSLFELGADANYTGTYETTLKVKNGTVLQGKGNVCGIQNSSANKKVFDVTFENVNFGTASNFAEGTKNTLFYAQDNCKANVDVTLTLTDCDIDMSGVGDRAYTIFSFASDDTYVSADIAVNGGSIKAETLDTVTLLTMDTTNDTFVWGKGSDSAYTTLTLPESYTLPTIGGVNADGINVSFGSGTTTDGYTTYTLTENPLVTKYGNIDEAAADKNAYPFVLFDANKNYVGAAAKWYDAQAAAKTYLDANPGKTLYILMRCEQSNANWYKSDGVLNGTVVLDLGGNTFQRGANSIIEAGTNGLSEAQCAFATTIIVKNGTILAGKSTSNNGVVVGIESKVEYNKTYNITFEDVIFGVSAVNYNSEQGMNNLIINDGGGAGTGVITVNLTLRDCTVKMISSDTMTVPTSTRLFNANNKNNVYVTIEGGSYEGTMSGITFANLSSTDTVTFVKGSDGRYFEFNITAGSVPSAAFPTDRGTMYFAKKSGNLYTLAVKADKCGNALIPYEIYDDTEGYPFIVYVEGKLVSAAKTWKAAQEAAASYLNSNAGGTVYILMRAEQNNANWYKSDGAFNGTVVLDLDGQIMHRGANSFLEICTNGLSEAQCAFVTNIIIKNGTILAGKNTNNSGHIVAVESNGAYNKTFNVTFENVTFGISKEFYNSEKNIFAVVVRDNGAASGATGVVTANFLFDGCTFDFTEGDNTVIPVADTTVFHTNPNKVPNNIDIKIKGGVYKGTHQKISFLNASSSTTLTYLPDDNGDYFKFDLTAGTPKLTVVNTDQGDGYFYKDAASGDYLLGIGRAKITGAAVTLGKSLSILYYVRVHDGTLLSEGALSMLFTMNGKDTAVTAYETANGQYVFAFDGIAPQQMGDLVDATVLVGDATVAQKTGYSIKQNCLNLLSKTAAQLGLSDVQYAAMQTLIADLLAYGQAAQDYKEYAGNGAILDGTEELVGSTVAPTDADAMTLTGNTDAALHFTSATVRFDTVNQVVIKVYASVEDAELVTLKIGGTSYALSDLTALGNGVYEWRSEGLKATEFDTVYAAELLYNGESTAALSYSVNAYAYAMTNGATQNTNMQALALALYRYGMSAEAYANAQ